jgi:uncharacterized protein (TIGR02300 family)
MAGKDLGTKHTCFKCGTKFYDFKKPEPLCPKCGADQRQSPALKAPAERRQKAPPKPAPDEVEAGAEEEVDEAELDAEDEDDDEDDDDDA